MVLTDAEIYKRISEESLIVKLNEIIACIEKDPYLIFAGGAFGISENSAPCVAECETDIRKIMSLCQDDRMGMYTVFLMVYLLVLRQSFANKSLIVGGFVRSDNLKDAAPERFFHIYDDAEDIQISVLLKRLLEDVEEGMHYAGTALASVLPKCDCPDFDVESIPFNILLDVPEEQPSREKIQLRIVTDPQSPGSAKLIFSGGFADQRMSAVYLERIRCGLDFITDLLYAQSDAPVSQVDLMGTTDKSLISRYLYENKSEITFDWLERFEAIAATEQGERPALVGDEGSVSYRMLNQRAENLAAFLQSCYGISEGSRVAILLPNSALVVTLFVALLKLRAVYVPVDAKSPDQRIAFILRDCKPALVLCASQPEVLPGEFAVVRDVKLEEAMLTDGSIEVSARRLDDDAYIIYTSGSTGHPKGVLLTRGGLSNLGQELSHQLEMCPGDVVLQFSSVSFDASILEFSAALQSGAALAVPDRSMILNPKLLLSFLKRHHVSVALFTPAYLSLLNVQDLAFMRCVISGGEAADSKFAHELCRVTRFFNAYGPTECSVCITMHELKPNDSVKSRIPVGTPLKNVQLVLLDVNNRPVPIGVPGELYVRGISVARQYLNQRELTAAKFVSRDIGGSSFFFHTGDVFQWLPDGTLDFLGRSDDQVKRRGFRIETGEISGCALQLDGVGQACCHLYCAAGTDRLVLFFVSKTGTEPAVVLRHLQTFLPDFMIPDEIIRVGEVPLTIQGKIDYRKLQSYIPEVEYQCHETVLMSDTEKRMFEIFRTILGPVRPDPELNFLEQGGNSLSVMVLINAIYKDFGATVAFGEIYKGGSIRELARKVETGKHGNAIRPVSRRDTYALSPSQLRIWLASNMKKGMPSNNIVNCLKLKGALNIDALNRAFRETIGYYEILRTTYNLLEGIPVQKIHELKEEWSLDYLNPTGMGMDAADLLARVQLEYDTVFNLEEDFPIRVKVMRTTDDAFVLCLTLHHIATDGWSMYLLIDMVIFCYNSFVAGKAANLPALEIQYKDFAVWRNDLLQQGYFNEMREYWTGKFRRPLLPLNILQVEKGNASRTGSSKRIGFCISDELLHGIDAACERWGLSRYMFFLAGVSVLIFKRSASPDIIIASPEAGRVHADLYRQMGVFINTMILRINIPGSGGVDELFSHVREEVLASLTHREYPFEMLVNDLRLAGVSVSDLSKVVVTYQNIPAQGFNVGDFHGLAAEVLPLPLTMTAKADLMFTFQEMNGSMEAWLEYGCDVFSGQDAVLITDELINIFHQLINSVSIKANTPGALRHIDDDLEEQEFLKGMHNLKKISQ
ncbi:amino acid adenylation domain-containing protein [Chitinophaga oryzae]|uniref:Amino acid adenylation domain-containing protein n=1 Tax=Chitinophaga oryzae TaxID=2725414 RepID=A0AAE6ZEA9_9BACT|nr:non-ribosomal peptide synthetase [Chitinophaga oryzae]QJB30475.1 amino acid adenylation domain-containing protein [Chitinophaga oryzae]